MKLEDLKKTKRYLSYRDSPKATLSIPKAWCVRFNLTPTELMIFEEIHQATHFWVLECYCASRTSLCVVVNASPPTVDKALENLTTKGFIEKGEQALKTQIGGERRQICYRSLLPRNVLPCDKNIEEILETNIIRAKAIGRMK